MKPETKQPKPEPEYREARLQLQQVRRAVLSRRVARRKAPAGAPGARGGFR